MSVKILIFLGIVTLYIPLHFIIFPKTRMNMQDNIQRIETDLTLLSEKFPTLQVICPTMFRKATGFKYLYKTFENFRDSLSNVFVDLKLNAFQRHIDPDAIPVLNHTSFQLHRFYQDPELIKLLPEPGEELEALQIDYKDINIEKVKKWHNQALDWIGMMRSWHQQDCGGSKLFLYIEDDFVICKYAIHHILGLYQWAEVHLDDWLVIRSTFGFAGLFLQCRDIPKLVDVIIERSIKHSLPIDTALAKFWDPHENLQSNNPRLHYTYRYVLFDHIGIESNVGNDVMRQYHCLGLMKSAVFHFQEQYDWACERYMLSPCRNPVTHELPASVAPELDIPISAASRSTLANRLGIDIIIGEDSIVTNCNKICHNEGMKCVPQFATVLNNCELIRKLFKMDCRCMHMVQETQTAPLYGWFHNKCVLMNHPDSFSCDSWIWGTKRVCPCREEEEIPITIIPKDQPGAVSQFNQQMMDYYSQVAKNPIKLDNKGPPKLKKRPFVDPVQLIEKSHFPRRYKNSIPH